VPPAGPGYDEAGPGLAKLDDPGDHPLFVLALGSVALTASVRDPEIGDEPQNRLYAAKRGSRPLIGVARTVFQSIPQCRSRRSR
jgi:hypothetical protein